MAACKALELTHPAVNKSLRKLEEMGIVRKIRAAALPLVSLWGLHGDPE